MKAPGERVAGLDGVRGLAILLVLGVHAPTKRLADGFVGVTVFFVLSGYLITGLLLNEMQTSGRVSFGSFYRRRFARLMPALVVVVAVTVVVLAVGRRDLSAWQVTAPALSAVGYITNIVLWSGHVFATGDYFNYTWTLAIEEQFYLAWPLLLYVGYRRWPRRFTASLWGMLAGLTLLDVYLGASRAVPYDTHEYLGSDTNALPILAGALLAILLHRGHMVGQLRRLAACAPVGLLGLLYLAWSAHFDHVSLVTVAGTGCALLLIAHILLRPGGWLAWLFSQPIAVWLGQRSYSLYLWNILLLIASRNTVAQNVGGDLLWLAAVLVAGELSYRLVERPARRKLAGRRSHPSVVTLAT